MDMKTLDRIIPRLRSQMQRGQPVLFTGAGFSLSARDRDGRPLPSTTDLRDALHKIAFPESPPDPDATIGDTFSVAMRQKTARHSCITGITPFRRPNITTRVLPRLLRSAVAANIHTQL